VIAWSVGRLRSGTVFANGKEIRGDQGNNGNLNRRIIDGQEFWEASRYILAVTVLGGSLLTMRGGDGL